MGDQEQLVCPESQVLAPPVGPNEGLAVQDVDRGVEGFQHGQRADVDATDRQTDGVAPQMVDQRFDLREFRHATSLPIAAAKCPSQRGPAAE
jgi:hypothetical protein